MYAAWLALILFAWTGTVKANSVAEEVVKKAFFVNVSIHIHSITDLDTMHQEFSMDSTYSLYYFLPEKKTFDTYKNLTDRMPSLLRNRSTENGAWIVVPYPNLQDFWRPELLCYEATSVQWQTSVEKPVTLSMRWKSDQLYLKLEQKKREVFDCTPCLKYFPMQPCECTVRCNNTIPTVITSWQNSEETYKSSLWFTGARRLIDNEVKVSACFARNGGICIRVSFTPIVSFIILSTFLPVCLLVLASFGTSFMSVDSIIERIAVSSVVFQSVLILYIQARLIIPPVSHITFMDIFLLASVLTVMATIFQSAVIKVLVQRRALYDISRHGRDTDIQNNVGNEVERGLRALRRRFRKSQTATSLFGTLFKYTTNRIPYPADRFNRYFGRFLLVFYVSFVPLFWCLAVYIAKKPPRPHVIAAQAAADEKTT